MCLPCTAHRRLFEKCMQYIPHQTFATIAVCPAAGLFSVFNGNQQQPQVIQPSSASEGTLPRPSTYGSSPTRAPVYGTSPPSSSGPQDMKRHAPPLSTISMPAILIDTATVARLSPVQSLPEHEGAATTGDGAGVMPSDTTLTEGVSDAESAHST